jgi:hypothetical protein
MNTNNTNFSCPENIGLFSQNISAHFILEKRESKADSIVKTSNDLINPFSLPFIEWDSILLSRSSQLCWQSKSESSWRQRQRWHAGGMDWDIKLNNFLYHVSRGASKLGLSQISCLGFIWEPWVSLIWLTSALSPSDGVGHRLTFFCATPKLQLTPIWFILRNYGREKNVFTVFTREVESLQADDNKSIIRCHR